MLQPSWKMNDLRAETRQSVESIKKVLEKIAIQITRGITRGEYELRTEYRTTEPSAMQTGQIHQLDSPAIALNVRQLDRPDF